MIMARCLAIAGAVSTIAGYLHTLYHKETPMKPALYLLSLCLVLASCGDDEAEPLAVVSATQPVVLLDGVDPAAGAVTLSVTFKNSGSGDASLLSLELPASEDGGMFALEGEAPARLGAGESWTASVRYTPAADGGSGCGLAALADAELSYSAALGKTRATRVLLFVGGECSDALRCAPQPLVIPSTVLGAQTRQPLVCFNASAGSVTARSAALTDALDGQLKVEVSGLPKALAQGDRLELELVFDPAVRGEYTSALTIEADKAYTVPVEASARRVRPLCSDPAPTPPALPTEIDRYTFKLETGASVSYEGQVASLSGVSEMYAPMLKRAMLLATGSYLDEFCKISHNGAMWSWQGLPCQEGEGTLFNVMPIALDAQVEAALASVKVGTRVRVEGVDIERIEREGFWNDGGSSEREGNHAMFVSRVCDLEE
jgi:hypothetical protein